MRTRKFSIILSCVMLAGALVAGLNKTRAAAIPASLPDSTAAAPTFNKDIAPIMFQNCATCHHPGEVAPFSLLTYADAKKHARDMSQLTEDRQMPPWKPEHGFGNFLGERRLTDAQIDTIQRWVKAGKPEGNAADLPAQPKLAEGWALGEPDLVVKMPKAFTLKAEGNDVFRSFAVPLNLSEDKYVEAIEFRPDNRKIVHHALFFLDSSGRAMQQDGADGQPGFGRGPGGLGFVPSGGLGGWSPGVTPQRLPDGVARLVKKGADLVIQTHFHPSGKVETEQASVGLYFARKTPDKLFISHMRALKRSELNIPAGDSDFELNNSFIVPADVKLQAVFPHAHLLCKEVEVTATLPDGKKMPIIWIKNWDWDWQDEYVYQHAIDVPKGTEVHMRFRFDNSAENVKNPSKPPKRVHWGEQTSDEMAIVFFQILVDRSVVEAFTASRGGGAGAGNSDAPVRGERLRRWLDSVRKQPSATQPSSSTNNPAQ